MIQKVHLIWSRWVGMDYTACGRILFPNLLFSHYKVSVTCSRCLKQTKVKDWEGK